MTTPRLASSRLASPLVLAAFALSLAGCHVRRGEDNGGVPGDSDSSRPFGGVSETETLHVLGTEPFWSGEARGTTLTYTTPATPAGTKVAVHRFAGRNGLGLSGTLGDKMLDMTVTPGACSDGMSDRRFPFIVTLKLGEEVRMGCGWTDSRRFTTKAKA
jgi:uncharacterized membrane protein